MFNQKGCGLASSGVVTDTSVFTPETSFNKENPTKFQYKSTDFTCFKFISKDTVYFKAALIGCIDPNNSACATPQCGNNQSPNTVKKRAATTEEDPDMKMVALTTD